MRLMKSSKYFILSYVTKLSMCGFKSVWNYFGDEKWRATSS